MGKKKSKKKVDEEPKRSHESYEAEIEAKLKIIAKDWFDKSYFVLSLLHFHQFNVIFKKYFPY